MSFESKLKLIIEEVVYDLMNRNYKKLESNGRMGNLSIEEVEDIRGILL